MSENETGYQRTVSRALRDKLPDCRRNPKPWTANTFDVKDHEPGLTYY